MVHIFRGQGSTVGRLLASLLTLLFIAVTNEAPAQLYEAPVLVVDPGMHTSSIWSADVDAKGLVGVTGSDDKTIRVWSLTDGKLLRTIRVPAGPDQIGQIYAVAMRPDGALVAAGGFTRSPTTQEEQIYLFETKTGRMEHRIQGLSEVTRSLAFSLDGRYLAAGLGESQGLRVYDRDRQWSEVFRDTDYANDIYGIGFAADGRMATSSDDGKVRLYDRNFKLVVRPKKATGGHQSRIAFSPDGTRLAVGYTEGTSIDLFDGHSLAPKASLNVDDSGNRDYRFVTWSKEGDTLYAGGPPQHLLAWSDAGRGQRHALSIGATAALSGLAALPDHRLLVTALDPSLQLLKPDGTPRWTNPSPNADFEGQQDTLAVSADGAIVDFGFERSGKSPLRFDVRELRLSSERPADHPTFTATTTGLAVKDWRDGASSPTLDGKLIPLYPNETSYSLAIHKDGRRFVLGTEWSLRAFDANGRPLWQRAAPAVVWAVNITGDGRLVTAAYGDGTIRWHRMDDGRELLALHVLADKQNWVAWTPDGVYHATPSAVGVLKWQVNRGFDAAADTVPVSEIQALHQPHALQVVLQELETARALGGIAELKKVRQEVKVKTGAKNAPGPHLYVLTVGVSDYGDDAKDLTLKFADRDAEDVANALYKTQNGSDLYAGVVNPQTLTNKTANGIGIFKALDAMRDTMARDVKGSAGQDLALIMFSGHGTFIDDQFYLIPYGVDNATETGRKRSAISASDFQTEVAKLAEHGRVLVLLDACHSAGLIGALPASNVLKSVLVAGNVSILTSTSTADKRAREDEKWQHGAFTRVLLDALSGDGDANGDGIITMDELTTYIEDHLAKLTGGDQQLGRDVHFGGGIFADGRQSEQDRGQP